MTKHIKKNTSSIRVIHTSWNDFFARVRDEKFIGNRIFRGQRNPNWKLSSEWERGFEAAKKVDPNRSVYKLFETKEKYLKLRSLYLDEFKNFSRNARLNVKNKDDEEWWALGRHYGLITPLLDWTRSPYKAAFFAYTDTLDYFNPGFSNGRIRGGVAFGSSCSCKDKQPEEIAIWSLVNDERLIVKGKFELFSAMSVLNERQQAQQGLYSFLTHEFHIDIESYLGERGLSRLLEKYIIPSRDVMNALKDLKLMGITFTTLYPDLGGAAIQANLDNLIR